MKRSNIFLTGLMGSGKSSVGKRVAEILEKSFVDTDALIAARLGRTINQIFADPGEEFFREKETEMLTELVEADNQVVATGGGMLANEANLKLAGDSGCVVYLKATADVLAARLVAEQDRPLLNEEDSASTLKELLDRRRKYYEAADLTIDVTKLAVEQVAAKVVEEYSKWLEQ